MSYRDFLNERGVPPGPWVTRPASVGRNAKRQDPQWLGPKDEHAVPPVEAGDARKEGQ